jgi:hypothetical protein
MKILLILLHLISYSIFVLCAHGFTPFFAIRDTKEKSSGKVLSQPTKLDEINDFMPKGKMPENIPEISKIPRSYSMHPKYTYNYNERLYEDRTSALGEEEKVSSFQDFLEKFF